MGGSASSAVNKTDQSTDIEETTTVDIGTIGLTGAEVKDLAAVLASSNIGVAQAVLSSTNKNQGLVGGSFGGIPVNSVVDNVTDFFTDNMLLIAAASVGAFIIWRKGRA